MCSSFVLPFIAVALPAFLCQGAVEHWLTKNTRFPKGCRPIAAWGAIALAAYAIFWAYFAASWLGWGFTGVLYTWATIYWIRRRREIRIAFIGSADSHLCRYLIILFALVNISMLYLWQSDQPPYSMAANRFLASFPADNEIPSYFADRLAANQSPKALIGDWLSSDRPPLQTGFILFFRLNARLLGDLNTRAFTASLLFQMLWVPGLWSLLRSAGARKAEILSAVGLVGCTGFCLFHAVYTWPKLGAAGLVMGGASLLLDKSKDFPLARWASGAALCALGYLAHGGVMFSLLALAPLTLLMRPTKSTLAVSIGAFLLIIAPWMCYQKFYEPPGNRLLKWHLAGVIPIDNRGTWETLYTSYHDISWGTALQNKQANLNILFKDGPLHGFDFSPSHAGGNRAAEFFHFFRALGLGSWLLLTLPWLVWRLYRINPNDPLARSTALLASWSALTLVAWILLMFGPGTTIIHQGSLVPLLLFWALPVVMLARWNGSMVALIAIAQMFLFISVWAPANSTTSPHLAIGSFATALSCAFLIGSLIVAAWRNRLAADEIQS